MFIACLVSFFMAACMAPLVISSLKRLQFGQSIREEGPQSHKKKAGTPTLGGIIFLLPITLAACWFVEGTAERAFLLTLTLGYGLIGFCDDALKVFFKRNLGLTAKQKLAAQFLVAGAAYALFTRLPLDTTLTLPHTSFSFDLSWAYLPFFFFLAIGTTNAANLTDGLDGLLTGLSIIAFGTFAWFSYALGATDAFLFSLIAVGALTGFLLFNAYPAKVFMGDTGSLAIGGMLVALSVLTKTELLLAVLGGVLVIETLSVILQVLFFKTTRKRLFKMTPIHHSFELMGWSEQTVVSRFWMGGLLCSLVALSLFTL